MATYHVDLRVEISTDTGITIFRRTENDVLGAWKRVLSIPSWDATVLYDRLPPVIGHVVMNELNAAIPDSVLEAQ